MIVYGDPAFSISPAEIAAGWKGLSLGGNRDLDALRNVLIACGQIEQALADEGREQTGQAETDRAAEHFLAVLENRDDRVSLSAARCEQALRIKIPEGYAFYAVYPEQYVSAADRWLKENRARAGRVLVVGIRSIGTSLSAVVRATLHFSRIEAHRVTIRPQGPPFERTARLAIHRGDYARAIVVDEGPGLSGSSIAAAVKALREAGIADVTIFPSHPYEPGNAASPEVREIWATTPRIAIPTLGGCFQESALYEPLRRETEKLLGTFVRGEHDLSAGAWKKNSSGSLRAGVSIPELERAKFVFDLADGRRLLWKFAGLGAGRGFHLLSNRAWERQQKLAEAGWCVKPLAELRAFIATEWIEGRCAAADDLNPQTARYIARYVTAAANPVCPEGQAAKDLERLKEMAACNLREAEILDGRLQELIKGMDVPCDLPSYGDGRLAPYKWIWSGERLIKTDVWGHDFDHTCIGTQTILWDIAGALLEWEMNEECEKTFLGGCAEAGLRWTEAQLHFYKVAYLAFWLGAGTLFGHRELVDRSRSRLETLTARDPISA